MQEAVRFGRLFCVSAALVALAACGAEETAEQGETSAAEQAATPASRPDWQAGDVVTTDSGLKIEVITMGEGDLPGPDDDVLVDYEGRLSDGTVFDSSFSRGQPSRFSASGVISGWTEALLQMPVGSKYTLTIPPELAYGERGAGDAIPPGATLVFDVELIDIYKGPPLNEEVAALLAQPIPAHDCGAAPLYDPATTDAAALPDLHAKGNEWQDCMAAYIKSVVSEFSQRADAMRQIDPATVPPSQRQAVNRYFEQAVGQVAQASEALETFEGIPAEAGE